MENKKTLEISYSFGYVFERSKLVVICPVGSNIIDEEEFDLDVEVEFLKDGVESAFSIDDIEDANQRIKPLTPFLGRYSEIVPLVSSIKNKDTNEEMEYLLKKFKGLYNVGDIYFKQGYSFKDIYFVCENIKDFMPKPIDTEKLNILKTDKDKFDIEKLIIKSKEIGNIKVLRKSNLLNNVYVDLKIEKTLGLSDIDKHLNEENAIYIPFAKINEDNTKIICADKTLVELDIEDEEEDIDFGEVILDQNNTLGYLLEINEVMLSIKIANFDNTVEANQNIAELIVDSGIFKDIMNKFINKLLKNQ